MRMIFWSIGSPALPIPPPHFTLHQTTTFFSNVSYFTQEDLEKEKESGRYDSPNLDATTQAETIHGRNDLGPKRPGSIREFCLLRLLGDDGPGQ